MEINMKILHTSDIHLESAMTKFSGERARERKSELYETFDKMVREAASIGVHIFIIAGDLFDTARITKRATDKVANIIEGHPEIDFLYLPGNHERDGFIAKLVHIPENLKVFSEDWTYYRYDGVCIAGRTKCGAGMFDSLTLNSADKNIVVLHGALVDGAARDEEISIREASGRGIDYIALGHYHSYSETVIDKRCVAVYSGTLEGRGFDEAGDTGFVLVNAQGAGVAHKFCQFSKRSIDIIPVDVSSVTRLIDIDNLIDSAIMEIPPKDIVRLVFTGERSPEVNLDVREILKRYEDRFFYFEAKDETRTKIDPAKYMYDKSFAGEFIRLVYSRENLTGEEKERILRMGLAALNDEDIG